MLLRERDPERDRRRDRSADGFVSGSASGSADGFSNDLLAAIRSVNEMQMTSANTKANFEVSGDVDVTEVLMKSQKASVAFEATLQIRNKILKAYQDVMSMPV